MNLNLHYTPENVRDSITVCDLQDDWLTHHAEVSRLTAELAVLRFELATAKHVIIDLQDRPTIWEDVQKHIKRERRRERKLQAELAALRSEPVPVPEPQYRISRDRSVITRQYPGHAREWMGISGCNGHWDWMPEFPGTHPLKKRLPAAEAEKIIASWRGKTDVPEADFGNIKTEKEKSDGIASSVDDSSSVASAARHPIYPMNPLLAEDFFRDVYADLFKCSVVCD